MKSENLAQQIEQLHGHILALELGLATALHDAAGVHSDPDEARQKMVNAFRFFELHPATGAAEEGLKLSMGRMAGHIEMMANRQMANA